MGPVKNSARARGGGAPKKQARSSKQKRKERRIGDRLRRHRSFFPFWLFIFFLFPYLFINRPSLVGLRGPLFFFVVVVAIVAGGGATTTWPRAQPPEAKIKKGEPMKGTPCGNNAKGQPESGRRYRWDPQRKKSCAEVPWAGCAGKRRPKKRASGLGGNPSPVCARAL